MYCHTLVLLQLLDKCIATFIACLPFEHRGRERDTQVLPFTLTHTNTNTHTHTHTSAQVIPLASAFLRTDESAWAQVWFSLVL